MADRHRQRPKLPNLFAFEERVAAIEVAQRRADTEQGKIMGELARLRADFDARDSDRPSQTDVSIRPTRARISFRNVSGWTVIAVVAIVALTVALIFK